ncbi:hypothetical protein Desaci_2852 [Desulfosporosinus acidiphilus SJ4]|uniref:Uncharacterized protein n=1 Tax=Desulfosporosinus acidiphilus (strain DSM 22704 / JCM 16185 / SJ4) TaxID=646529 RepID=I4D7J2_DESAJ|nr:hypothetical protein [Desulfosporosinus acidiphilus]AFM41766.1 hypothetical protein Desaci_2852 [Desulfosporosinus acidiphilus SJ4]
MEISEQDLPSLIEEGLQLLQSGCKIQDCRCIYWFLKGKCTLDRLGLEGELVDKFRFSLELEERVKLLQTVFDQ